jgi:protocatechuate 3,4-dioxygenase beta subunit
MSMEARGGGVTSTNAEGFFEIKELPAGRYTIFASKGGYVSIQYGQRRPGEQGTPLELIDAQMADKVNFALPRGSVIAGQITDDSGDPVAGTMVSAMRYVFMAGSRRLVPGGGEGGTDRTDDQGNFRLYGLPPGDYIVSATNRMNGFNQPDVNNTEADGYAPTYYPGTANIAEAARVPVRAGQQAGANFSLIIARLSHVRGRVINSRGEPATRAMVMMMPADQTMMSFNSQNNAMATPDGTFQLANVAPGRYTLTVRPTGQTGASDEFGMASVTVGSEDLNDLLITTSIGSAVRGAVITDDGSAPTFRADQVQLFASPAEPMSFMTAGNNSAKMSDDFTFEIPSVFDRRIIRPMVPMTTGWYVKGVFHDGVDITDIGMTFTPGRNVDGLQVVLTQKTTDLSGLVLDGRGKPVLDATVIVFPANRERWSYFSSRFLRTARPDTEGRYRIRSLPPDDGYLVIAVQGLQEGQASDPEFLARAREEARPISLNEGETKAMDVRLSTIQP